MQSETDDCAGYETKGKLSLCTRYEEILNLCTRKIVFSVKNCKGDHVCQIHRQGVMKSGTQHTIMV